MIKNNPFLPFKEGNYSTRKTQVCTNLRFKVLRNNASPILSEEEGNSGYRITLVKTQFSNVTFTGLGVRARINKSLLLRADEDAASAL